jgi:hypothetical protein
MSSPQEVVNQLVEAFVPKQFQPCGSLAQAGPIIFYKAVSQEVLTTQTAAYYRARREPAKLLDGYVLDYYSLFISTVEKSVAEKWRNRYGVFLNEKLSFYPMLFTILHEVGHVDDFLANDRKDVMRLKKVDQETYADLYAVNTLREHLGAKEALNIYQEAYAIKV